MTTSSTRGRFRLLTSVATGAALLFATAGFAQAQEAASADQADQESGSDIVVTGFRASLANSTNIKRNSSSIVEAVSAEDIGKLPDNSITEALARLPGLSAQRLFGRAQVITVRGLSPDFTTALLNGREQVSAGDNRGVEFDQYPSELLSSVVVYKTPDASLIGQGLAGTADMRTIRPLAQGGRTLSLSGRYEWNDIGALNAGADDNGYRVTAAYIDQSADHHWGWAIGAAVTSSPTNAERWESWGYPTTGAGELVIGGAKPYVQSSTLDRDGYMGVLQYAPSDTFSSTLDVFYSKFSEDQTLRGIELPLFWGNATLEPGYTVADNVVTGGTWTGVKGVVRNDLRTRDSTVKAVGWKTEWGFAEGWTGTLDLSYSSVDRHDLDLELYAGTASGGNNGARDTMNFQQVSGGGFVFDHQLNYSDPSLVFLTDPQGWGQAGFIKEPQTNDELKAIRLSAERELGGGFARSVVFGVNYSERTKDKDSIESFIDLVAGNDQAVPVPSQYLLDSTQLTFLGLGPTLSFDPLALLNNSGIYSRRALRNSDVLVKAWSVDEKVTTIYGQLNIESTVGEMPLSGNVGVQIVETDQSSSGAASAPDGTANQITRGVTYTDALPSLNLNLEITDNQRLRFGLARTLARARMDDMRASFAVTYTPGNLPFDDPEHSYFGGSGGNPELKPWISDGIDVSYERYFTGAGYVSLAVFYKYLENYIYPKRELYDFTGFPAQDPADVPLIDTYLGIAETPQNASGGHLQGVELTLSLPGEMFTSVLEGFGVLFNASSTGSNIHPPNTPASALPGLSETVINSTLYYEHGGFEARVSDRYRTNFLGETTGFGAARVLRFVKGESVVDAQIGYRFGEGPLQGLAIQLQGNNITDEPFGTFGNGDERQVLDYQRYGATYLVGLSYRR
jgi:iron complex outermembrane recepter protein